MEFYKPASSINHHHCSDHFHHNNLRLDPTQGLHQVHQVATTDIPRTDFNLFAYAGTDPLAICPNNPMDFHDIGPSPDLDVFDP